MTSATAVMTIPTPRVVIHPTASLSDSPARVGKSVGKMSLEMMLAWTFSKPEMLDIVALNIAASMIPTRPFGSRARAARA